MRLLFVSITKLINKIIVVWYNCKQNFGSKFLRRQFAFLNFLMLVLIPSLAIILLKGNVSIIPHPRILLQRERSPSRFGINVRKYQNLKFPHRWTRRLDPDSLLPRPTLQEFCYRLSNCQLI